MSSSHVNKRVDAYLDFRAALRSVLAEADVREFRLFLRDAGEDLGDPDLGAMGRWTDDALLPLMHRMIIADTHLSKQHSASRTWLRERHLPFRVSPTGYGWSSELRRHYRDPDRRVEHRSA